MAKKQYPDSMLKQLKESSKPKTSSLPNHSITETDEKLKYTLMELDNKNVVMSNVIVLGSQPTSLIEAKLLRILLSQTKSLNNKELDEIYAKPPVFYIEVKDLAKMFYTNDTSNIYRDIQIAAVSLTNRNIFFKSKDSDEWISYPWTSFVKYGNGILQVKINPDLYPYLVNMKGNFSKFSLDVLLSFKSKYSMRLYEGLQAKIYRDNATREAFKTGKEVEVSFDIDELRVVTSTVLIYSKLYNLKKRCIEPAITEITEKTGMSVLAYSTGNKIGNKKDIVIFKLKNKEKKKGMGEEDEVFAPLKTFNFDEGPIPEEEPLQRKEKRKKGSKSNEMVMEDNWAEAFGLIEDAEFEVISEVVDETDRIEELPVKLHQEKNEWDIVTVSKIFNGLDWKYNMDDIANVLRLYRDDAVHFEADMKKASSLAEHYPVHYMIKIAENRNNKKATSRPAARESENAWLTPEFERKYEAITRYWDRVAEKMREENPFEDGGVLKPIRKTDIRHKRFVQQLFEDDETVDSIQDAIITASQSAYFIRTQGSFNFFINPKNYFDIASGERDYDSQAADLWKIERGL